MTQSFPISEVLILVERFKTYLLLKTTDGTVSDSHDFAICRRIILEDQRIEDLIPVYIKLCRSPDEFRSWFQDSFDRYKERRNHISSTINPILERLDMLKKKHSSVSGDAIEKVDNPHIRDYWEKAKKRLGDDPDGALTAARSLLESVCKHILDDLSVDYNESDDLPAIYKAASNSLDLAPSQHTEAIFKQILGGCHSIVQGLGSLRSKIGDAHGKGVNGVKAAPRHAKFSVDIAGATSIFLLETLKEVKSRHTSDQG